MSGGEEYPLGSPLPPDVVGYRRQRLLEAGCTEAVADVLAELLDVDLHRAVELLESGCSPERALRILI